MITPACTRAIPRLPRAGAEATISARQAERSAGRTSGRNPSFTREQFGRVGSILGSRPRTSLIAKETGLTRQTICRINRLPVGSKVTLRVLRGFGLCGTRRRCFPGPRTPARGPM